MNRSHVVLFFLLVLPVLFTACTSAGTAPTPTLVPTPILAQKPTYTVQRGTVSKVLELRGRSVPVKQQDLFFGADGFVKEVLVSRGDTVKTGEVLARLEEPENYEANLAAAQLALEQAQYDFEQFQLDMPVKIAEAQLEVLKTKGDLDKAKIKRDAMDVPRVRDPLALEKAKSDLAAAKAAYDEAQKAYGNTTNLPEGDPERSAALGWLIEARRSYYQAVSVVNWYTGKASESDISLADAELAVAQAKYDRAVVGLEIWNQEGGPFEMRLAKTKISDAQVKLEAVKKSKTDVELTAPFDGQILSISVATGDQVSARKAVATLADPANLEISVIPSPEELADMGVGQSAVIRLSSQVGKEYPGKVRLLPDANSKDASARLVLDDPAVTLTLNGAVTVIIQIDERTDVLWLPPAALRSFQGRDFVLVNENGVQRRVDVLLGLKSADRIEIVSGLEADQMVVGP